MVWVRVAIDCELDRAGDRCIVDAVRGRGWRDYADGSTAPGGGRRSDRAGGRNLYALDVQRQMITEVTRRSDYDGEPARSADGSRIAFASRRHENMDIYVMGRDASREYGYLCDGAGWARAAAGDDGDFPRE